MQQLFCSSATKMQLVLSGMALIHDDPRKAAKFMREQREALHWSTIQLADAARHYAREANDPIKLSQQSISKFEQGDAKRLPSWFRYVVQAFEEGSPIADLPVTDAAQDYLPVEILPSFAGMGGGGNGDGDPAMGLISRRVIEDELRARPSDLLLIDVRGDSMQPDFHHGDQILIDKRDTNLAQPGSFCIWDGDGYVIKLVERIPQERNKVRVFSANNRYSPYEVLADEMRILGRPVWFARRL